MPRFMKLFAMSLVAAAVAAPASARADDAKVGAYDEARDEAGQVVKFRDDPLDGTSPTAIGAQLRAGLHPKRITLLRPRMNFVPELRRSVEHM